MKHAAVCMPSQNQFARRFMEGIGNTGTSKVFNQKAVRDTCPQHAKCMRNTKIRYYVIIGGGISNAEA